MSQPSRTSRPAAVSILTTLAMLVIATACRPVAAPSVPRAAGRANAAAALYDAPRDLGLLFHDVQMSSVFSDSKTFVDYKPLSSPADIVARYATEKTSPQFDLRAFIGRNFESPKSAGEDVRTDTTQTMEQHIGALWTTLTRPADPVDARSTLIALPQPYVVPGGRFREVYYWDSYFTMLGLLESRRSDLVKNMLDNFAHLIATVGHIPNGNRTYYLGRSQPPFFAAMVGLYAKATDTTQALRYLNAMEAEHAFWMDGADRVTPGQAYRRVVMMPEGVALNRYWDDLPGPRPEAYRPDVQIGETLPDSLRERFYRNARASAESGWDFSSRWMRDPSDLKSLETTELIPIDLNSLMYNAERMIAALRSFRNGRGDADVATRFNRIAERRRQALLTAAYEPADGYFYDVRWRTWERVTDRPTLAAASVLFFGLALPYQAVTVANRLDHDFLKPGGFVTTNIQSGQQWDAPNGWPPLEWMAIEGVRRYGGVDIANKARDRWLALNRRTYQTTGRMTEKYDVVDLNRRAGGGEYPTQDGFGWTNGVALALSAQARPNARPSRGIEQRRRTGANSGQR